LKNNSLNNKKNDISREIRERGWLTYKRIMNVLTITLLVLLYRSIYVNDNDYPWLYIFLLSHFIVRLHILAKRERKASEFGIPVTEYIDNLIEEEKKNKGNN